MVRSFTKMQGCGNDYIYFNCMELPFPRPEHWSQVLSNRHFGVGADGIILLCPSETADVKMRMFNADGSEGQMCGNGIRCAARLAYEKGIVKRRSVIIDTLSGVRKVELSLQNGAVCSVTVNMGIPIFQPERIPVLLDGDAVIGREVLVGGQGQTITCVSMGNPHCVVFILGVEMLPLSVLGPRFENAPIFPERINAEFVEVLDRHTLLMRVWERGSGETLACGTGACAAVVAAVENGYCSRDEEIAVRLRGGILLIRYTSDAVYMTGNAETVFTGEVEIETKGENDFLQQ